MSRCTDLTGNKYGRLIVLSRADNRVYSNGRSKVFWKCICQCGNTKVIAADNLKQGDTNSCGCLNLEMLKARADNLRKEHPMEWESYRGMLYRVSNVARYKGLGMEERWKSFSIFLEDMGPRPSKHFTLDRINTKVGYFPSNCRWADKSTQAYNAIVPTNNSTGRVGVTPLRGKYQANIGYKGKLIYLGIFTTTEEASRVREAAELEYYGYTPNY